MSALFPEVLEELTAPAFLGEVCRKYHYEDAQIGELQGVAEEMHRLICGEAFWESGEVLLGNRYQAGLPDAVYQCVVMSLGKGIDRLQESYSEKVLLSRSYMIEVLASELLVRGYDAYNRHVRGNTDRHVARYHFPGGEEAFPLELLPELLGKLTREVTCNSAFCMQPKKSVVFVAELTRDEKIRCQGICMGCHNGYCPNRITEESAVRRRLAEMADMPLPYGYSRILGIGR